ncbi:UNVERIFIED_CONTAM: hypothetical protein FKN15_071358 [Acipenser sinensis]
MVLHGTRCALGSAHVVYGAWYYTSARAYGAVRFAQIAHGTQCAVLGTLCYSASGLHKEKTNKKRPSDIKRLVSDSAAAVVDA